MKVHRILAEAVINTINDIFNEGRYADKAIEKTLKQNRKWGSRDRGFIAEYTYEMVRWWRLLTYAVGCENNTDKETIWLVFAALHIQKGFDLPPWKEFVHINRNEVLNRLNNQNLDRKIKQSVPDWLDDTCAKELGPQWDVELECLNKPAPLVIRTNTLKTNPARLQAQLQQVGVDSEFVPGIPGALLIPKRVNLFSLEAFKNGLFDVQDGSSQLIAPFLEVEPGMRVIDACAGAGGKTLHIASLMQNKGRVIAMDTSERKLEELMRRAKRAGINNVETKTIDTTKVIKRLENSADRLLLDVPCSGLGVLRRNPDAKWKLTPEFLDRIKETQQQILSQYAGMLKPGGLMVYATCSILPSENENQVAAFLLNHPEFICKAQQRISVSNGFDGFFMALLEKSSSIQ